MRTLGIADERRAQDRAQIERQIMRGPVVAGDEAPQQTILDDRHRGRRADIHVAEIFEMDRRDAPQRDVRQIEVVHAVWTQRGGIVMDVGDDADSIADVQRARLLIIVYSR